MVIHAININLNGISFLVHLQFNMLKPLERYQRVFEVSKPTKEVKIRYRNCCG